MHLVGQPIKTEIEARIKAFRQGWKGFLPFLNEELPGRFGMEYLVISGNQQFEPSRYVMLASERRLEVAMSLPWARVHLLSEAWKEHIPVPVFYLERDAWSPVEYLNRALRLSKAEALRTKFASQDGTVILREFILVKYLEFWKSSGPGGGHHEDASYGLVKRADVLKIVHDQDVHDTEYIDYLFTCGDITMRVSTNSNWREAGMFNFRQGSDIEGYCRGMCLADAEQLAKYLQQLTLLQRRIQSHPLFSYCRDLEALRAER